MRMTALQEIDFQNAPDSPIKDLVLSLLAKISQQDNEISELEDEVEILSNTIERLKDEIEEMNK